MNQLRHDMLTHGVNIVCASYQGQIRGLTVAWATQIAVDLILICVGRQSSTREFILNSKAFGLSVLYDGQVEIARLYGTKSSLSVNKFESIKYHTAVTGSPLLNDCVAAYDCQVKSVYDHDNSKLIIGKVVQAEEIKTGEKRLIFRQVG